MLDSISRLYLDVCTEDQVRLVTEARDLLAIYRHNEDLISVGAYAKGTNPKIDRAIEKQPLIQEFLRQVHSSKVNRSETFLKLKEIMA